MGSLAVVVLDVRLQHRAKMAFAQKEQPIEALGADRSDEPFGIADGKVAVSYFRIAGPDRWGSVDKESHGVVPITVHRAGTTGNWYDWLTSGGTDLLRNPSRPSGRT
jgi:hypothetical protein